MIWQDVYYPIQLSWDCLFRGAKAWEYCLRIFLILWRGDGAYLDIFLFGPDIRKFAFLVQVQQTYKIFNHILSVY